MRPSYRTRVGLIPGNARRLGGALVERLRQRGRTERDMWQATFEHSPVGICMVGLDGRLNVPNRALARMIGYSQEELRACTFRELTHPDDLARDVALYEQALRGERSGYRLTKRFIGAGGEIIWGELMVTLVRSDEGTPLHFIGQVMDMTGLHEDRERLRQAMDVIEEERNLLQAILDTVDVGLVLVDAGGGPPRQNRRQREILATADPQAARGGRTVVEQFYAADGVTLLPAEQLPSARAVRGEEFDDERVWIGPDPAGRRALSVSARTVRGADGEPTGAALAFSDVTELEHALRARDIFESSVSHELRTPLTAVLGHLEMLIDEEDLADERRAQLRVAQRNANRLRLLVSDLLDPAARGEGTLVLFRAPSDVAALARETVEAMAPTARAAGIELTADATTPARALVDAHRVRQVLDNLVSNAMKYSDVGGRVGIRVETARDLVVVTVTDTGIGIQPEAMKHLWEPFFRAEEARMRVSPGVGLGLGIARSIVQAHGGLIDVVSEPGHGSTFRAVLPCGEPTPVPPTSAT